MEQFSIRYGLHIMGWGKSYFIGEKPDRDNLK